MVTLKYYTLKKLLPAFKAMISGQGQSGFITVKSFIFVCLKFHVFLQTSVFLEHLGL